MKKFIIPLLLFSIQCFPQATILETGKHASNLSVIGEWKNNILQPGWYYFGVVNRSTCTSEIEINYNGTFVAQILDIEDGEKTVVTLQPNEWHYFFKNEPSETFTCWIRNNTVCNPIDSWFWEDLTSDIIKVTNIKVKKLQTKIITKNCKNEKINTAIGTGHPVNNSLPKGTM